MATTSAGTAPAKKPSFASVVAASSRVPPGNESNSSGQPDTAKPSANEFVVPDVQIESRDERVSKPDVRGGALAASDRNSPAGSQQVSKIASPPNKKNGASADVGASRQPLAQPEVVPPHHTRRSVVIDDGSTQVSSSDGSGKLPSVDGKSITSATTFAMDEKESLRPDDSASLRAVEEEEATSGTGSVVDGSRVGSESGGRAFQDQLREISIMVPQREPPAGASSQPPAPSIAFGDGSSPATARPATVTPAAVPSSGMSPHLVVDRKLLDALESGKDRVWVLKIEQDLIDFLNNPQHTSMFLPQCNSFYRMLAHKLADYYLLGHTADKTGQAVEVFKMAHSRLSVIDSQQAAAVRADKSRPVPLSTLAVRNQAQETPPPNIPMRKIMRRGGENPKSGTTTTSNSENPSKATSEAGGDSASDLGAEKKAKPTREEREARYREARLRIFGNAEEAAMNEPNEQSVEDLSRSSSASGKKKNTGKRHRNNNDDEFEARSQFNPYYGSPSTAAGYGGDGVFYGTYHQAIASPVVPMLPGQYPAMADNQHGYGWPSQGYHIDPSTQQYDLSADFQRGMQAFQAASPNKPSPSPNAMPVNFKPQTGHPVQPPWTSPVPFDATFQSSQNQFGSNQRPQSSPSQMVPQAYPYGQLPFPSQNGKPMNSQHPIPGSFNRQQFNPQSQPFMPGAVQGSLPMQQPQVLSYPQQMQMSSQGMFATQRGPSNFSASPRQTMTPNNQSPSNNHSNFRQPPPNIPASATTSTPSSGATNSSSLPPAPQTANLPQMINPESTIAKWGTPAHLPPKPPQPTNPHPQKWMETHQKQMQMQGFASASPGLTATAAEVARMGVVNGGSGTPLTAKSNSASPAANVSSNRANGKDTGDDAK